MTINGDNKTLRRTLSSTSEVEPIPFPLSSEQLWLDSCGSLPRLWNAADCWPSQRIPQLPEIWDAMMSLPRDLQGALVPSGGHATTPQKGEVLAQLMVPNPARPAIWENVPINLGREMSPPTVLYQQFANNPRYSLALNVLQNTLLSTCTPIGIST